MNLLQMAGAQPQKQPKYVPIFIDKAFTGLFTQRAAEHDPSDLATSKFYGGRPDTLWMGSNVELTNNLTLKRRPGLVEFSTATYPTTPNRSFSFQLTNGTIQVVIDTGSTGSLVITSVAASIGGTAVYTGVFPSGGSNAYVGLSFQIPGFSSGSNNGTFVCTASTTTTLTLANPSAVAETRTTGAISAGAVYIDNQNGTKTLLFAKSPGAGQTYFVAVAGVMYMGDGVDTNKYTPLNSNGTIWNWGIATPTAAPTVSIKESGSAATVWAADTWFSTMGIIIDQNHVAQQLVSVNANGANPDSQFGLSGNGGPNWNQSPGGTTADGSITWTNLTPIGEWRANSIYSGIVQAGGGTTQSPAMIYDPASGGFYANSFGGAKTSGGTKPPFSGIVNGPHYPDGTCNWVCYANVSQGPGNVSVFVLPNAFVWEANTTYGSGFGYVGENTGIIEPNPLPINLNIPLPGNIEFFYQHSGGGTSQSGPYTPWAAGSPTPMGVLTTDNQLQWISLGSSTWAPDTHYSGWTASNSPNFNCVVDSAGCLEVCTQTGISGVTAPWNVWVAGTNYSVPQRIVDTNGNNQQVSVSGTSGGSTPSWSTTIGGTTSDGSVTWTNAGPAYGSTTKDGTAIWTNAGLAAGAVWATSQSFNLPTSGFSPPSSSDQYGGSDVIDSNSDVEFVVNTGVSGGSPPSWGAVSAYTADGTVEWYNNGAPLLNSLSWTKGYVYAYSFKARSLTDFYTEDVSGTSLPPIPPGLSNPLPAPTGSETGGISTASAIFTIIGPNAGAVNTISGLGSTDPQVDTIVIWRSADGGSVDSMFELTEIPAPQPINGAAQPWSFADYLPDTPTSLYPGLNPLIPAPIDDSNDPPPLTFLPMVYNFQRIWGANGQNVPFSGGPDVITGNPNESFDPADSLPFLANVVRLVKTSQGLITFLTDSIEVIAGGPQTASFYSVTLAPGTGLLSYNALDQFAGEIYFFSSDNRFVLISPSLNLSNSGFPIGDQLANIPSSGVSDATWNPANVYVTFHQNGIDSCLFIANGSTGWYRQNPHQVPGGAQGPEPIWSPFANITNGCKMVQSVETTPGMKSLLVGSTLPNHTILKRSLTTFTDDGTPYDAYFVMGSITLAHPGQLAVLKFLEFDFSGVSYQPTVSFLLNEIAGTFTPFTLMPVFDPPSLYGATISPTSYSPQRYYFAGTQAVARCRHLQIKVDFGTTSTPDELYDMCIFGRIFVEG